MLLDFNEKEKRAKMELSILLMEQIAKLFIMIFMGYAVVKMGLLKDEGRVKKRKFFHASFFL